MIRVTIELISANDGSRSTLGVMDVYNDGTSQQAKRGHYNGRIYRKDSHPSENKLSRVGRVEDYPRESYVVWRLILKMLIKMFPEEKTNQKE